MTQEPVTPLPLKHHANAPNCDLCGDFDPLVAASMRFVTVPVGRQTRRVLCCPNCLSSEFQALLHAAPVEMVQEWYQERIGITAPKEGARAKTGGVKKTSGPLLTTSGSGRGGGGRKNRGVV